MSSLGASQFLGVGGYVPKQVVTNHDLSKIMDTNDEWITQRSGIKQRHWVTGEQTTSDLALEASKQALEIAGIQATDLDCIVFATLSPDHEFPGTGCFLQAKLGVSGIPAIDVRQQCTGFIYAVSIADQFIKTGMYKKVLVVGAEVHSKGMNKTDAGRDVTVLFGDGAGAVVMGPTQATDSRRVLSTHLHADGNFARELWTPGPGMAMGERRWTEELFATGKHFPEMNGKTVFMHATRRMPEAVMEALNHNGLKVSDIDLFMFHQANLRINEMVAKQLQIPAEKVFNTIDRFGNTTAATIPLGLSEAVKSGALKPGMLVASAAFGSGFTWGSAVFRW
jgi:3-oxoacyl-[acyl-carrier-protein] synthase-3